MEMEWDGDELTVFCLAVFSSADPAVFPHSSPTSTSQFLCQIVRSAGISDLKLLDFYCILNY